MIMNQMNQTIIDAFHYTNVRLSELSIINI